jgi:hypothetical protein
MPARKKTDLVQCGLRLREELRHRVEVEARKNRVPLNQEIARRLERSFDADAMRSIEAVASSLASTWARVRKGAGKAA